ncbi:MAG: histidinol-phosphate transaminase [Patulibacter sp.]
MGLFDYYKQFEGLSEEEVNSGLRKDARARRAAELARIEPIDCSRTTWHEYPPSEIVDAITYNARRGLQRYAEGRETVLRELLAQRHGVADTRVVIGEGASGILQRATHELLSPGDELVIPWPCYPLYPLLARDAHATPVPVSGLDPERLLAAVTPQTRMMVLGGPNDPTGELLSAAAIRELRSQLPERVVLVVDEALREFVTAEPIDATLRLTDELPGLVVVRSFSKIWGLAGLRSGYAVAHPDSTPLLATLAPRLGSADLSLAGSTAGLRTATPLVTARAAANARERDRLTAELTTLGLMVTPSQSCAVWVRPSDGDGSGLVTRLEQGGVIVQAGGPLGDPSHVRITVRDGTATERITRVLAAEHAR